MEKGHVEGVTSSIVREYLSRKVIEHIIGIIGPTFQE
jgi:hypothetical protein